MYKAIINGECGIRTHGPTNLWLKLRILAKETMLKFNTIEFRAFPAAIYSNLVD